MAPNNTNNMSFPHHFKCLRKAIKLLLPAILFLIVTPLSANVINNNGVLLLQLDSESTVPPANVATASGTGSIMVDITTGAISGSVTVTGTTGQPTAAHVHQGGIGEAGPIVVGMEGNEDGSVWTITEGSALDAVGIAAFIEGNLYINVHTMANMPGELRVQLLDSNPITLSMLQLDSESTVPPANVPGASGTGSVMIDTVTGAISGSVMVSGTTGQPTAAHAHQGGVGEAGPIVVGMEGNDDGSVWTFPAGSALDTDGIQAFINGNLYINVHTEANMPGELRVQLPGIDPVTLSMLVLDSAITVPPANVAGASGTGSVTVNTVTGAISGSVMVSGTSGQPTAAHVHRGGVGEAGPIVVGMEANEDGSVWTIADGAVLDAMGIQDFIDGNLYINVHTETNPPGELRVQLVEADTSVLGLNGEIYSSTALELFWNRQPENVVAYQVVAMADGTSATLVTDGTSLFFDELAADTQFMFTVTALDVDGNEIITERIGLTTLAGDNATVSVVNLTSVVYSSSAIELFWDVSNAPAGITFAIFRDGELVSTTDGRSYFENGLAMGTEFTYAVEPQSGGTLAMTSLMTLGGVTDTAGTGSLELSGTVYSTSALELFWQRIDTAVTYTIERDGELLDERDSLSFFDNELNSGTTVVYVITAIADDGNVVATEMIELTTQ